jgi:hypothetical protein
MSVGKACRQHPKHWAYESAPELAKTTRFLAEAEQVQPSKRWKSPQ